MPGGPGAYAQYITHPDQPLSQDYYLFEGLSRAVRQHLAYQIGTHSRATAERMLWVQGRPGQGKTVGIQLACHAAGFGYASLSAGLFAGETEGASVKALHAALGECQNWSAANKKRVAVLMDDLDLSAANVADGVGSTVNTQLLVKELMDLADHRERYANHDGTHIGFIVSVNDASGMRESLTRNGRATFYTHEPTYDEIENVAWKVLKPVTAAERDLVSKLVKRHRKQNIAFWYALYHRMVGMQHQHLTAQGMPSTDMVGLLP